MTIVELLVVVAVIMVLVMLMTPGHPARESARRSACLSNVRQIGLACQQFALDNNGSFPTNGNPSITPSSCLVFWTLTNGCYLAIGKIYLCPSDQGRVVGTVATFGAANNSYACVVGNPTGSLALSTNAVHNPLIFDRGLTGAPGYVTHLDKNPWRASSPHKNAGNVYFVDGHAASLQTLDFGTNKAVGYVLEP